MKPAYTGKTIEPKPSKPLSKEECKEIRKLDKQFGKKKPASKK